MTGLCPSERAGGGALASSRVSAAPRINFPRETVSYVNKTRSNYFFLTKLKLKEIVKLFLFFLCESSFGALGKVFNQGTFRNCLETQNQKIISLICIHHCFILMIIFLSVNAREGKIEEYELRRESFSSSLLLALKPEWRLFFIFLFSIYIFFYGG